MRLPVLKVHDHPEAGCIIVGRVETGSIRSGLKVPQTVRDGESWRSERRAGRRAGNRLEDLEFQINSK